MIPTTTTKRPRANCGGGSERPQKIVYSNYLGNDVFSQKISRDIKYSTSLKGYQTLHKSSQERRDEVFYQAELPAGGIWVYEKCRKWYTA